MRKQLLVPATSALILVCSAMAAIAQGPMTPRPEQPTQQPIPEQQGSMGQGSMMSCGMMGQGGMMGRGMMGGMGGRMMGGGMMGSPLMMRMIFGLMDGDGDGAVSLPEFQAAHERIFKAMDSNKDGRLTPEEMLAFMHGTRRSGQPQ